MRPYLIHQDKMWFVIQGCRIIAIVDNKADGMLVIRGLPPSLDDTPVGGNGADRPRRN